MSSRSSKEYSVSTIPRQKEDVQHIESTSRDEKMAYDPPNTILEHYTKYPNRWSRIRYLFILASNVAPPSHARPHSEIIREPMAEFFGVMILIIFGNGVDCQVVLSGNTAVASSPKGVS